jgi:heptaprenyl diphosphate synthase
MVGMLVAVGTALFVIESYVPTPFPFLKIGFANISSVLGLILLGPFHALVIVVVRVVVGSMLVGSLLTPGFLLAFGGGVASVTAMIVARKLTGRRFGPVGISLIGSVTHVSTQLLLVQVLFVHTGAVVMLLPILLLSGGVGGILVGLLVVKLLPHVRGLL